MPNGNSADATRQGQAFRRRATTPPQDIALLVGVDEAHDTLSGPRRRRSILYREFFEFADVRYERLATISVAHIYNLRKRRGYREKRMVFHKTRPTPVSIGERRHRNRKGGPPS